MNGAGASSRERNDSRHRAGMSWDDPVVPTPESQREHPTAASRRNKAPIVPCEPPFIGSNKDREMVPGTGVEPVRPLCRKAADFKSAVSTNSTIRAAGRGAHCAPLDRDLPGTTGVHRWRRDPESNRADRICNPVHNRFAIAPKPLRQAPGPRGPPAPTKKGSLGFPFCGIWSGKRVSNSRPQPWQGCALPTELFPRFKPRSI